MKVLNKLVSGSDLKIRVSKMMILNEEMAEQQINEIKTALRGYKLGDNVDM